MILSPVSTNEKWDCLAPSHDSSTEYGIKQKVEYILMPYKQFHKTNFVNW